MQRILVSVIFFSTLCGAHPACRSAQAATTDIASRQSPLSMLPVIDRIKVPVGPGWLGIGFGSVWVSEIDSKAVFRIDPVTNQIIAKVPVGSDPELGVGIGAGFVWIADTTDRTLSQIDPQDNRVVRTIPVNVAADPEGSIAIEDGSVWILTSEAGTDSGTLTRIDVTSGRVIDNIAVRPKSHAVIAAFNAIWVSSAGAGTVSRIDPKSNSIVGEVPVHSLPRFLVASDEAVWVLSQGDGTLERVDPLTNTVVATVEVNVPGEGGDLAVGEHYVWVSGEHVPLTQIDPRNNRVVRQFVGGSKDDTMRVGFGSAWILFERAGQIWRIDLKKLARGPSRLR